MQVAQPRDLMTKRGKQIQKCDVQVFDETCNSFLMTMYVKWYLCKQMEHV